MKFALSHLGGVEEVRLANGAVERLGLARGQLHLPSAIRGIEAASGSDCTVRVIPTNEDLLIARHMRTPLFPMAAAERPHTSEDRVGM